MESMLKQKTRSVKLSYKQSRYRSISLALIAVALMICTLYVCVIKEKPDSPINHSNLKSISPAPAQFTPTVLFMNGSDVIYHIPDSPKAVLFIAHGCDCHPSNFWDKSANCPNCKGLPEDRNIVIRAIEQKFAVLTISSIGRCWTFGKEKERIKWLIKYWVEKNGLEKLPLTGLGASSGGYFISVLATRIRFNNIVIMIAEGIFVKMEIPDGYPPTLFVHMPKDARRLKMIKMNMDLLKQKGVTVKEVRSNEFPLTPNLLSNRIPGLDPDLSVKIFQLFREKGFIDQNGFLRKDGRETEWKKAVKESGIEKERYDKWVDSIQEELNLAYAYHEMTSLQLDEIFDWFELHMS